MAVRRQVVLIGLDGVRDLQSQAPELQAQGLPGDPQQAGRLLQLRLRVLQDHGQQEPVELVVRTSVEVAATCPPLPAEAGLEAEAFPRRQRKRFHSLTPSVRMP